MLQTTIFPLGNTRTFTYQNTKSVIGNQKNLDWKWMLSKVNSYDVPWLYSGTILVNLNFPKTGDFFFKNFKNLKQTENFKAILRLRGTFLLWTYSFSKFGKYSLSWPIAHSNLTKRSRMQHIIGAVHDEVKLN